MLEGRTQTPPMIPPIMPRPRPVDNAELPPIPATDLAILFSNKRQEQVKTVALGVRTADDCEELGTVIVGVL